MTLFSTSKDQEEDHPHVAMESIDNTPIFANLSTTPLDTSNPEPLSITCQLPHSSPAHTQATEETPLLLAFPESLPSSPGEDTSPAPEIEPESQTPRRKPFLDRHLWGRTDLMTNREFLWSHFQQMVFLLICWTTLRIIGEVTGALAWGCAKTGFWRMIAKTIFGFPWDGGGRCGAWCDGEC
jgi:hypothetical protein